MMIDFPLATRNSTFNAVRDRFFTKIPKRIIDPNDPQGRWILWIILKTGYFGHTPIFFSTDQKRVNVASGNLKQFLFIHHRRPMHTLRNWNVIYFLTRESVSHYRQPSATVETMYEKYKTGIEPKKST